MKVKIGNYKNFFGPYQLATAICFWAKKKPNEFGIKETPDWVDDFGEFLAYGSIDRSDSDYRPFALDERSGTWLYKLLLYIDSKRNRKIKVQIDPWDSFSADHTLALIVVPLLKQLKQDKHGAPQVDLEDVPERLRPSAEEKEKLKSSGDVDEKFFERWDFVMDMMIWAFEQSLDNDTSELFSSGEFDMYCKKLPNGNSELCTGSKNTYKFNSEAYAAYQSKIDKGLMLFAKYYSSLWD